MGQSNFLVALKNPDLALLIGFYIVDQLPFAISLNSNNLTKGNSQITVPGAPKTLEKSIPKNIENLTIYPVKSIGQYFNAKISSTASSIRTNQMRPSDPYTWQLTQPSRITTRDLNLGLWAHKSQGPGVLAKEVEGQLVKFFDKAISSAKEDKMDILSPEFLLDQFAAGYMGLRYGKPVFTDLLFLGKADFFGIFGEFRSGLFDGFRLYYDQFSNVEETLDDGQVAKFEASRLMLAWSFRYNTDWLLLSAVDFTPKIGRWSFKLDAPVSIENQTFLIPFQAEGAFSISGELGFEKFLSNLLLARLWLSQGIGIPLFNDATPANIVASKVGINCLVNLPQISFGGVRFYVSVLGFAFWENIGVIPVDKQKFQDENGFLIENIDYSQAYIGSGLSISW